MGEIQILVHSRKRGGGIFSECCTDTFKAKLPQYVNVVLFEMVKTSLKDTYIGGTTPTKMKNEVSACRKMYYDREKWVMINQLVNNFYTRLLFKMYALPQDVISPLGIAVSFLKNYS